MSCKDHFMCSYNKYRKFIVNVFLETLVKLEDLPGNLHVM